jgi:hypothetical protein
MKKVINKYNNYILMKKYKGYKYFLDEDGLWKVILSKDIFFIVALDDSKIYGNKKIISKYNNEQSCKKFIDLIKK